jgi:chromosome segregation ATPase
MSAIIREKYEASVLTNEAIEIHLQYLRSGLDSVQTALPVLRDKIDQLSTTMDSKFEKVHSRIGELSSSVAAEIKETNARIDAVNVSLSDKIDKTNARIEAVDTSLSEKIEKGDAALGDRIDKLTEKVSKVADGLAEVRGYQKTLSWVLSLAGIVAAAVSIAHTFRWI